VNIFESIRNVLAIPDLRKRLLFSFALLGVYRIGSHLPTPGLDAAALEEFFRSQAGGLLGFLDIFSGGALRRLSVFALGITPYITASIILQLLTVVWPYLEKLSKEGEMGRRKITQYTRYGTIVLSVVQSLGIAIFLEAYDLTVSANLCANGGAGGAGSSGGSSSVPGNPGGTGSCAGATCTGGGTLTGPAGATIAATGAGNAFRSTFPFGVNGSRSRNISRAGTIGAGRRWARYSRSSASATPFATTYAASAGPSRTTMMLARTAGCCASTA
jgi:hypothetical protein